MIFKASHPAGIKHVGVTWNHFYVEVTDDEGNTARLNADRVFVGSCGTCKTKLIAYERTAKSYCPRCGEITVDWDWDKPQLAFLPHEPSLFKSPKQKTREQIGGFSDPPSEGFEDTPTGPPKGKP